MHLSPMLVLSAFPLYSLFSILHSFLFCPPSILYTLYPIPYTPPSAIAHRLQHAPTEYLKRMYFDAVSYSTPALQSLISQVGEDRIMFGTDNPFFPPLGVVDVTQATWPSTVKVYSTIGDLGNEATTQKILTGNASRILGL
jgi:predicted TIM-barrel fold metal-dependent hydrolase